MPALLGKPNSEVMPQLKVPGISIAVINNGVIEWAKAWGVKEAGKDEPVTTDTLFQAASISKPLAAVAMMKLVEEGQLSLDVDPDAGLWGLGFQLGGEGQAARFSHGGGNIGYRCRLLALSETGQGVIIMTNSDNGGELNQESIANLARLYGWPGFGQ